MSNYFEVASTALEQMLKITGAPQFSQNGLMLRGVVVRHLVLPSYKCDSRRVLKYLHTTYGDDIFICIMNQFTITDAIDKKKYPLLAHPIKQADYESVVNYAIDLGIKNALIQEGETSCESFIPPF